MTMVVVVVVNNDIWSLPRRWISYLNNKEEAWDGMRETKSTPTPSATWNGTYILQCYIVTAGANQDPGNVGQDPKIGKSTLRSIDVS